MQLNLSISRIEKSIDYCKSNCDKLNIDFLITMEDIQHVLLETHRQHSSKHLFMIISIKLKNCLRNLMR